MHQQVVKLRKFEWYLPIVGVKEGTLKNDILALIETSRGLELGRIVTLPKGSGKKTTKEIRLRKIIRYATTEDQARLAELEVKEADTVALANRKSKEHELPIRVVAAEYLFDESRILLYYRVDEGKKNFILKGFIKDMVGNLKAKVDLTQLSARDEARLMSGIGPCGRVICCASYLERPLHITVKRVKELGLQISPTKTSGVCGKLFCCLQYEDKEKK